MNGKRRWDMTSLHSCECAAEWIREKADGLLVIVIRGEDVAVALAPSIVPRDVPDMVEAALVGQVERLEQQRLEAKARAKVREYAQD